MNNPRGLGTFVLLVAALCTLTLSAQTQKTDPPKLTEAQVEALQQQRVRALKINALITQVQTAMQARDYRDAASGLTQLIELDPSGYEFYAKLGAVQLNLGKYQDALQTLGKGIPLAQSAAAVKKDPVRARGSIGQMLTNQGNAYVKLGKNAEALAAYERAAAIDPNPGMAYFNLCATRYNMGDMDGAAAACDKAIAADPTKADAYFIKGSALYGNGKLDAHNKYIVPPGTIEALKKYLELAPNGGHVADVKAMLEALDTKIETTFGQKKK